MADSRTRRDLWAFESIEPVQLAAAQALQDIGVVIPHGETSDTCVCLASYLKIVKKKTLLRYGASIVSIDGVCHTTRWTTLSNCTWIVEFDIY